MATAQGKATWEQMIEDAVAQTETEVRRAVAYLNDEIVPEIHRDSLHALRAVARELTSLADRIESRRVREHAGASSPDGSRSTPPTWNAASR